MNYGAFLIVNDNKYGGFLHCKYDNTVLIVFGTRLSYIIILGIVE